MRVYLQSQKLGQAIARELIKSGKTQISAAIDLNIAQGQISHLVSGHFKTKNHLVVRLCEYVNIDPDIFKLSPQDIGEMDREAVVALARACGGQRRKTQVVIRVLRALETLASAG